MSALLVGFGWKLVAGLGALLALGLACWRALAGAKSAGVAQQQTQDLERSQRDADLARKAQSRVDGLDDAAVLGELHRDYDRK